VQEAAAAAGLDSYVRGVLGGYDAVIGPGGAFLSAGQRQRIGLARALYGRPFLVVLDEPNSNLDQDGEIALQSAIRAVRQRGGIVIVVAHRQNVLNEVDLLLALAQGGVLAYGPREDVLAKLRTQQTKPAVPVASAPVVEALAATKMGAAILKREPHAAGWVMVPPRIVKPGETRGQ
jgi:ABC-type protease/lipase transport system fused ATPase/permease subunit